MTTTTTTLDLDTIKARTEAATPGQWDLVGDDEIGLGVEKNGVGYSYDVVLVQVAPESDRLDDLVHNPNQFRIKLGTVKADAEFIAHARHDVPALVAEVERLRAQMAAVEKFVAARAEYITAIDNCHPDNSADYWRWQGHAEGRRQLSQTLGLPVGWPTDYDSSAV